MPEIRLDTHSPPHNSQKVRWLTLKDEGDGKWKEGEYVADGQMFVQEEPKDDFDTSRRVLQWEPI